MRRNNFVPFGYKLTFSYLLFVLIPILIIGYFAYTTTLQSVREQTNAGYRDTLRQMKDNIAGTIADLERVSDLLYLDQDLQEKLRWYWEGWNSYEVTSKFLIPKLLNTIKSTGIPIWLSLYLENETLPEIMMNQDAAIDPLKAKAGKYEIYHLQRIAERSWYQDLPLHDKNYNPTMIWQQIENDAAFHNVSLLRRLDDAYGEKQIGFMRITMKIPELLKAVDAGKLQGVSRITVMDGEDRILLTSAAAEGAMPEAASAASDRDYLTIEERIPKADWRITTYIPREVFEKDADKVRQLTILVCLGSFLFLALLSYLVSKLFARRIRKIVTVVKAFREGDFQERIHDSGNDEFAQIAAVLNKMGQNIDELIREVYVTSIQKREAEIAVLQAQINPHFLYNTLSSISRLAEFGEIGKLNEMVIALSRFYRLTLNGGRMIISIHDELQQAKAYIQIQKIRYNARLEVSFQIDEEVLHYDTVKLILQPFIENVMEHSWLGDDRVHLKLQAYLAGGDIVFKIIDDGVGIHLSTLNTIFDKDGIGVGFGIRNVDERIKLQFGDRYGVTIASRPGIGTGVQIVIPAFKSDVQGARSDQAAATR
ncbi:sensor histidine kinase [Paenibacillus sp. GCM10027626]|uniref:sensor histidine kinase n=1 Tax=Paenibacillus sp. GCM10027626 TaxID=3273411 RepID=UPI00362BB170